MPDYAMLAAGGVAARTSSMRLGLETVRHSLPASERDGNAIAIFRIMHSNYDTLEKSLHLALCVVNMNNFEIRMPVLACARENAASSGNLLFLFERMLADVLSKHPVVILPDRRALRKAIAGEPA